MRRFICCVLLTGFSAACFASADEATVTVVLSFERPRSFYAIREMMRETERLSPIRLRWRRQEDLRPGETFAEVALVRMKGACEAHVAPVATVADSRLAYTYSIDGNVIPFADVECDRVRALISPADDGQLGLALGRVLAHELHHLITRTSDHTKTGYRQRALTSADLTETNEASPGH